MSTPENTTEIDCEIRAQSDLAILVFDGQKTVWVPRSEIINVYTESGQTSQYPRTTLTIPTWLAQEKGINTSQADNGTLDLFGGAL